MKSSTMDKVQLERSWADHEMLRNSNWSKCNSTHRVYLSAPSRLVIWEAQNGRPNVIEILAVSSLNAFDRWEMVC